VYSSSIGSGTISTGRTRSWLHLWKERGGLLLLLPSRKSNEAKQTRRVEASGSHLCTIFLLFDAYGVPLPRSPPSASCSRSR
jgi:hypothetical protein